MRHLLRALAIVFLCVCSGPAAGKPAPAPARKKAQPAFRCDTTYRRPFTVTRGGAKVQLRLLKLAPPAGGAAAAQRPMTGTAVFDAPSRMCRDLGPGWRVAVGSFGASFLKELRASDAPDLKAALAACPVTYQRVDTVCAPCVASSQRCPCADRDISDWIFCEKP